MPVYIVVIFIILSGVFSYCRGLHVGGTYPGVVEEPKEVSLTELAHYYGNRTNGLIRLMDLDSANGVNEVKFVWDPYYKMRIFPATGERTETIQRLFALDVRRFVEESGDEDFLSATEKFYRQLSFDRKLQNYTRPYRYLSAWGNLFYPPIKTLVEPLSFYHSEFNADFEPAAAESRYFDPEFQKVIDHETQTELTYGNELRALFNGTESYPEKLRFTTEAKKILYIAVMTIVADETGRELIRNMVNAKRAGVDVRVITEGFYTFSISNYSIGVLEREGIPVVRVDDKTLSKLDRVFHDKFWIRDGEEAILGGMNVLDYENEGDGFNFLNRDTDILIRGPAVTDLLGSFIKLWKQYDQQGRTIGIGESILSYQLAEEKASGVRGSENYERWLQNPGTRMNGICRTAVQGNNAQPQNIATILLRYLEAARGSFYVSSPEIEFDPGGSGSEHLNKLARLMMEKSRQPDFYLAYITNGVDGGLGESNAFLRNRVQDSRLVGETLWEDMLTPIVESDGREVNRRVRKAIRPMLQAGVHGFQYFNYNHAKTFYFDRILVGIGSWNFDEYSADKNHEAAIFCMDEELRRQFERQTVLDLINSVPIVP